MGLEVTRGNFWNYYDMDPEATVYTLEATGTVKEWRGVRYQPDQIWLMGEIDEMAAWIQKARDSRLDLNRSTGWNMRLDFKYIRGPLRVVLVSIWWEQDSPLDSDTNINGPLPSLDFVFQEWALKNHLDEYVLPCS